jgi:Domain of unknown function (DUF4333)
VNSASFRRVLAAAFVGAALLGTYSTAAGAAAGQVPKGVVESHAAKVLAQETGQPLPHVVCPSGLKAKVGASIKCTLTPQGTTTQYPVRVTVQSIHNGVVRFHVQVGQAIGAGNKIQFCKDNAQLDMATSAAQTPSDLIPIFRANAATILDFQANAPAAIVVDAGTLVAAAKHAVDTGNASAFTTSAIQTAGAHVDAFCGQNPDGSPIA